MKILQKGFEDLGMKHVQTYINTGNIVFVDLKNTPEQIVKILENMITEIFDLQIKVLLRDLGNFENLIKKLPDNWSNDKVMKSDVLFLWEEIDNEGILSEFTIKSGVDTAKYVPGAVLWSVSRDNQSKSGLQDLVKSKLYKQITVRNVNTTRKIYNLMQARV